MGSGPRKPRHKELEGEPLPLPPDSGSGPQVHTQGRFRPPPPAQATRTYCPDLGADVGQGDECAGPHPPWAPFPSVHPQLLFRVARDPSPGCCPDATPARRPPAAVGLPLPVLPEI